MAKESLSDDAGAFNTSNHSSTSNLQDESILEDHIEENLAKAKALITVLQCEGLHNCSLATQHDYLSVLEDVLNEVGKGFARMRDK